MAMNEADRARLLALHEQAVSARRAEREAREARDRCLVELYDQHRADPVDLYSATGMGATTVHAIFRKYGAKRSAEKTHRPATADERDRVEWARFLGALYEVWSGRPFSVADVYEAVTGPLRERFADTLPVVVAARLDERTAFLRGLAKYLYERQDRWMGEYRVRGTKQYDAAHFRLWTIERRSAS